MRRRRELQLFSFSFIDILATNIGVLLFVMLMAVLNVSGTMSASRRRDEARQAQVARDAAAAQVQAARAAHDAAEVALREARQKRGAAAVPAAKEAADQEDRVRKLTGENEALNKSAAALAEEKKRLERELADLTGVEDSHQEKSRLPRAIGGSRATPVHVDCRGDGLVILGTDVTQGRGRRQFCPVADIDRGESTFGRLLREVSERKNRPDRAVIVLWIRPNAIPTGDKAIRAARNAGAPLGWEPADGDWEF